MQGATVKIIRNAVVVAVEIITVVNFFLQLSWSSVCHCFVCTVRREIRCLEISSEPMTVRQDVSVQGCSQPETCVTNCFASPKSHFSTVQLFVNSDSVLI